MKNTLIFLSLCLLKSALAMNIPIHEDASPTALPHRESSQTGWQKIQDLYQVYEKIQSPPIRTEIIHGLNHLLLTRQFDLIQKEEALVMADALKARHLALRLQQDQAPKEYGDFNSLPQEIFHEVIQNLKQDLGNIKDLRALLLANKSFHMAMASASVHLTLTPCRAKMPDTILAQIIEIFPNIVSLGLSGYRQISDTVLEQLMPLTKLSFLDLSYLQITDRGLLYLKGLAYLTTLNLRFCANIRDQGLENLKALPNLTTLNLIDCYQITDESKQSLKAALPMLQIIG